MALVSFVTPCRRPACLSRMDDWRIPFGLGPVVLGLTTLGVGYHLDMAGLQSLGLGVLVWELLVLAFGNRGRD